MKINYDSLKPVYLQIAEAIEDDIIDGRIGEGDAAYSQLIISRELGVNPATAAKGINLLVAKGILERQRGAAMTVAKGAADRLIDERRGTRLRELIENLVSEAAKLGLGEGDVLDEVKGFYKAKELSKNKL